MANELPTEVASTLQVSLPLGLLRVMTMSPRSTVRDVSNPPPTTTLLPGQVTLADRGPLLSAPQSPMTTS
jgi:hypothetical protein